MPDPIFEDRGIVRHILMVPVRGVPVGIPLDPNARVPNLNKQVYKDIRNSLLNEEGTPNTFHLKHKGITVVAEKVESVAEDGFRVTIDDGQGILDGGHTYTLILRERDGDVELPEDQFVKFEIITKVPNDWIPEMAGGLNTSVQVQAMSLENLKDSFEWMKDELGADGERIAWRENEDGIMDARDLVSLLTAFNVFQFPNDQTTEHPVMAYEKKSEALKLFQSTSAEYRKLRPLLKDILVLHDTIRDSSRLWNDAGGKFGLLAFVEAKKGKGEFAFPFTGRKAKYRLMNGALYPMLAAFRWMVDIDPKSGQARWRGGFDKVIDRWEASAEELLRMTAQTSNELGRNPNAIGKSRSHWANLHTRVAMRDLMAKAKVS